MIPELEATREKVLELARRYPQSIPIAEAARVMGVDEKCLRNYGYRQSMNPFLIGYEGESGNKGYSRIITLPWVRYMLGK
jgi:hypothetical protein